MNHFSLNHTTVLDDTFYKYLLKAKAFLRDYDSLLDGIQDLNLNNEKSRVVFINSKCAKKGYLCINCDDDKYDFIRNNLNEIIELHNNKKKYISEIFSDMK